MNSDPLPHLFVKKQPETMPYRPRRFAVEEESLPEKNRQAHGTRLKAEFEAAWTSSIARRIQSASSVGVAAADGIYLEVLSDPELELALDSLDSSRSLIELLAVKKIGDIQVATIFIPDSKRALFLRKIENYLTENRKDKLGQDTGKPKNQNLIERITSLKMATVESLWTDLPELYPSQDDALWWEVWLRGNRDAHASLFRRYAEKVGLVVGEHTLSFLDRTVVLVFGKPSQMSASIDVLGVVAEFRIAKDTPTIFDPLSNVDIAEFSDDLMKRTTPAPAGAPAVCILDTGVNQAHPLIRQSLAPTDLHSVDPAWGTSDHKGHGTEMAGLSLYGNLVPALLGSGPIALAHCLESVKILPPDSQNDPDLYGKVTAEALARAEIQAPDRTRIVSLSVSSSFERDLGRPSSWSAEIDNLSVGVEPVEEAPKRLFVVCAGNRDFRNGNTDYFEECLTESIHNPGQAWNALTVGAYTDFAVIHDVAFDGFAPLANPGDLSPSSTTSVGWERQWPIKPEIVMEGGNAAASKDGTLIDAPDDLSLLTTNHDFLNHLFRTTGDTSAATAQAARLAATVQANYPKAWPETIRALLVHSARWTPRMNVRFSGTGRAPLKNKLRCFGFGVPDLKRALHSYRDVLTLVIQSQMRPFEGDRTKEMHFHRLPWPKDELLALGETEVQLRVTLSYFVEANPGRRGWTRRHSYASHGFRFDMKTPTESDLDFRKRINELAWEQEKEITTRSDSSDWLLGSRLRGLGSIHSDIWKGTAADLAARDFLGVFPVIGWWRERYQLGKWDQDARYSLIISIETPPVEVDIYTPVANQISIPTPITVLGS